jgi:hypothetical protein
MRRHGQSLDQGLSCTTRSCSVIESWWRPARLLMRLRWLLVQKELDVNRPGVPCALMMPSLTQIKDAAANSSYASNTLRKLSLRDTRVLFNAKCGRFWVVLSHPGASAFLLVAIGVLSQDKLLTVVNALIAAVRNSEPLRDTSKEMTPGVGPGIACYLCCTAAQGDKVSLKGIAR